MARIRGYTIIVIILGGWNQDTAWLLAKFTNFLLRRVLLCGCVFIQRLLRFVLVGCRSIANRTALVIRYLHALRHLLINTMHFIHV